jgi:hypothetical protein
LRRSLLSTCPPPAVPCSCHCLTSFPRPPTLPCGIATKTKVAWSVPCSVWLCRSVHQLNMGPAAHWQRDRRGHGAGLPLRARATWRAETNTEWHQLRHRLNRQPDRRLHLLVMHRGADTYVVVSLQVSAWQRLDTTPHNILNQTPAKMSHRPTPCSMRGRVRGCCQLGAHAALLIFQK